MRKVTSYWKFLGKKGKSLDGYTPEQLQDIIDFAETHARQACEVAADKAEVQWMQRMPGNTKWSPLREGEDIDFINKEILVRVDKQSILNSYNRSRIKIK